MVRARMGGGMREGVEIGGVRRKGRRKEDVDNTREEKI